MTGAHRPERLFLPSGRWAHQYVVRLFAGGWLRLFPSGHVEKVTP